MTLFDRIGIIRATFARKSDAADAGLRWVRAARAQPGIIGDLIRMGGILSLQPDQYHDGVPLGAPIDPVRLAYDRGRRDLAAQLCALAGLTHTELQSLMEDSDDVS